MTALALIIESTITARDRLSTTLAIEQDRRSGANAADAAA
jgi:hypothetical protein